jgi:hypothetical protein
MGDGYCRHCDDETKILPVNERFLQMLIWHMRKDALLKCRTILAEEIRGNCDNCGAERSRRLLELVSAVLLFRYRIRDEHL